MIPMGSGIHLADPETGLAFVFAASSIASLGVLMAGYTSNNKYSFLGGLRAVAQNIAYEIPLVVTDVSVVIFVGSLQMSEIVAAQAEPLVTIMGFTIPSWFAIVNPFAFVLFLTANLAEVGRNPFDTPEAASELVAGFMTSIRASTSHCSISARSCISSSVGRSSLRYFSADRLGRYCQESSGS